MANRWNAFSDDEIEELRACCSVAGDGPGYGDDLMREIETEQKRRRAQAALTFPVAVDPSLPERSWRVVNPGSPEGEVRISPGPLRSWPPREREYCHEYVRRVIADAKKP